MCGAARRLDGDLVRGRGLQPRGRVRRRTETPCVHRGVVEILPATGRPVAFHCPALEKTTEVVRHSDESEKYVVDSVKREGLISCNSVVEMHALSLGI